MKRKNLESLLLSLTFSFCTGFRVRGLDVEQSPSALSPQEGAGAALKCNFSSSVNSVQWFRQNLRGGGLTSLFFIASGMKQSGRLNCTVNMRERSSTLHIAASQLEDAASYLCAAETQCCLLIRGLHATYSCACAPAPPWGICTHNSLGTFSDFQIDVTAPFPSKMRPIRAVISLAFLALIFLYHGHFGASDRDGHIYCTGKADLLAASI
uniref:Ig-like domain-containing protein n=1 Tax=Ailuropoda melanoleuca TaxID=9646 RepID=A0A7N5K888_AILME